MAKIGIWVFCAVFPACLVLSNKLQYTWFPDEQGRLHLVNLQLKVTPKNVTSENITFELWTRETGETFDEIIDGDVTTLKNFNKSRPTRFLIHGFGASSSAMGNIRNSFMQQGDYNLIAVDWSIYASGMYNEAAGNAKQVADFIADTVEFLVENGADPDDIHLIGHSLGAQISGLTGSRTHVVLGRITGLDPARPLFEDADLNDRLDASDAAFVQVIHTNAGMLGIANPVGHVDFFPNGGIHQPGCGLDLGGGCSHGRSREFFQESIVTTVGFVATLCNSIEEYDNGTCINNPIALMGEFIDHSSAGTFYLTTSSESPYALGLPERKASLHLHVL